MISGLTIRNFKCFASLDLRLKPLTVLTGVNGAGKSTVVQALLIARQAADPASKVVQLNGPYGLALGEAHDILHPDADPPVVEVTVETSGVPSRYLFDVPYDRTLNLPIRERCESPPTVLTAKGAGFTYLNAERLGPRDQLDVTAEDLDLVGVGVHGESAFAASADPGPWRDDAAHPG
jgi:hypothetical protein